MRFDAKGIIVLIAMMLWLPVQAAANVTAGLLVPYSGVFAPVGKEIDKGFILGLEEADMLNQITVIRENTEFDPKIGLAKVKRLIEDNDVDVLVGVASSGVLAAVRRFVHEHKTPLIVANAGNDHETGIDCSRYIIRVSFSNSQITRPLGQWMYDRGIRTVYTMAPDYAAGHQIVRSFSGEFLAAGGLIIGESLTPSRTTKDFTPYLQKVRAAAPDAVFAFYAGGEAISYVKQYAAFGLSPEVSLFGPGFLTSPLYVRVQGDAAVGIIASLHYVPTLDTAQNQKFVQNYKRQFGGKLPSEYTVQGYDAAQVLARAVKKGANTRRKLTRALPKVKYEGPRGPLTIDKKTNNIIQNVYIYETIKGEGGLTQKILGTIDNARDEPHGCKL